VRLRRLKKIASGFFDSLPVRGLVGCFYQGKGIPFRGTRIHTESAVSHAGPPLLLGNYERAEIDFMWKYLPRELDVLELGSSIGAMTCQISRALKPDRTITCVEGNPRLIPVLRRNLAANSRHRQVVLRSVVVGDSSGPGSFNINSSSLCGNAETGGLVSVQVQYATLQDICASSALAEEWSLVCDIEGAETTFLRDPIALRGCACIILEAHRVQTPRQTLSVDDVLRLPLETGEWDMIDRFGSVAVYRRRSL
jgi:FkbM family methyltransferase